MGARYGAVAGDWYELPFEEAGAAAAPAPARPVFRQGEKVDRRAFRDVLGCFATGVVVVTADAQGREPVAMTVSSFNAVSLDPPLVLFSILRSAPSLSALLAAESFGISVLRHDQSDLSRRFAYERERKWEGITPQVGITGCPLLGSCLAAFECVPFAAYDGGDHLIIVGRVLRFERVSEGDPLVFFRGGYHVIAGPKVERIKVE